MAAARPLRKMAELWAQGMSKDFGTDTYKFKATVAGAMWCKECATVYCCGLKFIINDHDGHDFRLIEHVDHTDARFIFYGSDGS